MSEPLVLSFKSDTAGVRNEIANLASSVVTNMMTIGSAMKAANDNVGRVQSAMTALPTILRTAAAAFVAFEAVKFVFEGVSKAVEAAADQVKKLQDISAGSRSTGVGSEFFQVMSKQLEKVGLDADEARASLVRMRAALTDKVSDEGQIETNSIMGLLDELRSGRGIASNAYNMMKEAGPDDIEARIKAVTLAIKELGQAARETGDTRLNTLGNQLAGNLIADPEKAKQFADNVRAGKVEIDALTQSAQQAGSIFNSELVARSKDIDDRLKAASDQMHDAMMPIMRDLAALGLDIREGFAGWTIAIDNAVGALGRAYGEAKKVREQMDVADRFIEERLMPTDRSDIRRRAAALGVPNFPGDSGDGATPGTAIRTDAMPPRRPPPSAFRTSTERPEAAGSSTDEVDTYIKSLEKAVEVLKAENDTFGKSNTLKAEAVDLEKALAAARTRGTALTDEERAKVKALADEEGRAKDKAEELRKSVDGANARATFLGDQAISAIERIGQSGVRAKDVILDFAKALEKAALQAALLGTGPLAQLFGTGGSGGNVGGLFGGLFGGSGLFSGGSSAASNYAAAAAFAAPGMYGPGFASGGLVGRDGERTFIPFAALAGARHFATGGGIPAILHPGEVVLNAAQQTNVADKIGGGATVHYSPTINGSDLTKEQLLTVLAEHGRQIVNRVQRGFGSMQADWQRRHG